MHDHYITLGVVLKWLGITLLVGSFLIYVVWQSRIFLTGPVVTVHEAPPATTTSQLITIAGHAQNIVWITLNGRPIATTPEGDFKEQLVLESGYTIIELHAADRFGRSTTHRYPVVPSSSTATST